MSDEQCKRHSGISPKMAMLAASRSMSATIQPTGIRTGESDPSLLDQGKRSFSELATVTPCLFGGSSSTPADKPASIAPSSATKAHTSRRTLSDRLTQSLITFGLVRGITHTSIQPSKFALNQPVRKISGYTFDGFVRMRGHLTAGERYVVESEASPGLLHIFSDAQLETRSSGEGAQTRHV